MWWTTWHSAFVPHKLGHGFVHFCCTQTWLAGHSELDMHSGLQFGGVPLYSGRHEQEDNSLTTWQRAYGPHGDGWQGFTTGMIISSVEKYM